MRLFIFGSTGDLIKRKVLTSIQSLKEKDLEIYALGRRELDRKEYQNFICEDRCELDFKERLHYLQINYDSKEFCLGCIKYLQKNKINYFYVALPPKIYENILIQLGKLKKKGFKIKILLEKPFGNSLKEAKKFIEIIRAYNLSEDLLLADHYLFKKEIKNLKEQEFHKAKLVSIEKIGLEGRINFYDDVGALKDMIQSHLLNILFKILLRIPDLEDLSVEEFIRGQYKGYTEELGRKSGTETFAYVRLEIDDKKIEIITGKAMNKKEINIGIDKKRIKIECKECYRKMFEDFLSNKKGNFPSIENSLLAWEIIEKILKKKSDLIYYKKGAGLKEILK